ncbi:MAG: NAD(P)-dependent oxidoreductase [Bacteroidales bacterium]|nr:NAD(P)-dependent oxidoreductase [Bacteroidales bacterium]
MAVYVTGAAGFLGRATVLALAASGFEVVAVTRAAAVFPVDVRHQSVRDYGEIETGGDDVLIHLAETPLVAEAQARGDIHLSDTRAGMERLLSLGWGHVVYASSAVVYGDAVMRPRREVETVDPRDIYGRAKRACEVLILNTGGAVARFANLIGPGMAHGTVLSDILDQIATAGPLRLRDVTPVRDFLDVRDAAEGIVAIVRRSASGIFNFGSGQGISIGDLADLVLTAAHERGRPVVATAPAGRTSHLVLDIGTSDRKLGWRPTVPLDRTIAALLRKTS